MSESSSSFTLVDDTTVGTSFAGRSHFQGVPTSYGLRQGEIICADTPKEVTHWTADMPKEVTRSLGEDGQVLFFFVCSVIYSQKFTSTTAFPNAYIKRQQITMKVDLPGPYA
nr:hypothetical protein [Tanacetum cinerariifolium]